MAPNSEPSSLEMIHGDVVQFPIAKLRFDEDAFSEVRFEVTAERG